MRSFEAVYPSGRDWACTHALGRRLYGNSTLTAPPPAHIAAPQEAAATHPHPFGVDADLKVGIVVHDSWMKRRNCQTSLDVVKELLSAHSHSHLTSICLALIRSIIEIPNFHCLYSDEIQYIY